MLHRVSERLNPAVLFVVQGAMNGFIETPRRKIGLNTSVHRVWTVFVEPRVQLLDLLWGKSSYGAFNVLNRGQEDLRLFYTPQFCKDWRLRCLKA